MSQRLVLGGILTKRDIIESIKGKTKNCCHSCLNLRRYEYPEIFMLTKDGKLRYFWTRRWNRFTGKKEMCRIIHMHTDYRCAKDRFGIQQGWLQFIYRNCPDYLPDKIIIDRLNRYLSQFGDEAKDLRSQP